MKNKYYFFMTFLLGLLFVFVGIFAFLNSAYFMYMIVMVLGILIFIDTLSLLKNLKTNILGILIHLLFACLFIFTPKLPLSIVVMVFALYVSIMGISHFVTYCYYRKEKVNGRLLFLLSAIVLIVVGISFILSPSVHTKEMTYIFVLYTLYLGIKYMFASMKELLSENRKNSLKRRIRVSLPIFMVAFMPRVMIEYINEKLEVEDEIMKQDDDLSSVEVFVHVSKDGFGAIGHVDICYQNEVIAYGAYDEASTHLFGAIGEGVLFIVDKEKYISFCHKDDMTSHIFAYTLTLNEVQKERIEDTIDEFKKGLVKWAPPCIDNQEAQDYASRLYQGTRASFYKFKSGMFKYYFVMTTNCVLLADRIIGKSGIDIVNMNGIITPGTYLSYFEEEYKKENSRVIEKHIY
ncbi:MAG: DUF308 domain-containing protein [Coprobacillus cateniformis]|uniref:HdeD family acid-resistance protein n=1 Tax=Longibaculum muris TaxID=1796628 RepID=UPI003AB854EB|nr:DUF308 domain-containing protein [Coprobacillus cateniformis]